MVKELFFLYAFLGLMVINLTASFVYLMGYAQLRSQIRKVYHNYTSKPR